MTINHNPDLNNVLNTIKQQFRYFEHMLAITNSSEQTNHFKDKLVSIKNSLYEASNLLNISKQDKDTIDDYYHIIQNILVAFE
jgi:hypothetical protein